MQDGVPEADWKRFRKLREKTLERFCERILEELRALSGEPDKTAHERYLAIYQHLHERDKEVALAFNDARRSQMFRQLRDMLALGLVTDDELAEFSEETRKAAKTWLTL